MPLPHVKELLGTRTSVRPILMWMPAHRAARFDEAVRRRTCQPV